MIELFLLILGLIGLFIGSGLVVEAVKKLSTTFGISHTFIGLTVISIGTSLPEIATNISAGLKHASGIAIGTNIGSCLAQITLIFGITGLIGYLHGRKHTLKRNGFMVLFAIAMMFIVGFFIGNSVTDNIITWYEGLFLIIIYLVYLIYLVKKENFRIKVRDGIKLSTREEKIQNLKNLFYMIIGISVLVYAAHIVVQNAIKLSQAWGVAESFVGVMIIGVGAGLPELSTAIRGIMKKAGDISVGTLIGSNITDPLFSLGAGAVAAGSTGLLVEKNLLFFDIPFWFLATVIAIGFLLSKNRLDKKEAVFLLLIYATFVFMKIKYFA
ncbi:sodium:calcium antiporter [Candidatus Woesearchaeota archaeon]|nr:sodium:calcium antiporter [Candidatus Woesearchaeota archaeon]